MAGSGDGRQSNRSGIKRAAALTLALLLAAGTALTGCGSSLSARRRVVLTSGFTEDDVFTINASQETLYGTAPELRIYLLDLAGEYEDILGSGFWNDAANQPVRGHAREEALARLVRVKELNLMAGEQGVTLTDAERAAADSLADDYIAALTKEEKTYLSGGQITGLSAEEVRLCYRQYMLADRMYDQIISPVDTEISDDEARILTAESILFRTVNDDGTPKSEADQKKAAQRAKECLHRIQIGDGTTFDALISEYSDSDVNTFKICRNGQVENSYLVNGEVSDGDTTPLAEAAYQLAENEKSGIIETSLGYRIVKCITTFDRAETDANKKAIVARRQAETFDKAMQAYEQNLDVDRNDALWDKITLPESDVSGDGSGAAAGGTGTAAEASGASGTDSAIGTTQYSGEADIGTAGAQGFFARYDAWKAAQTEG